MGVVIHGPDEPKGKRWRRSPKPRPAASTPAASSPPEELSAEEQELMRKYKIEIWLAVAVSVGGGILAGQSTSLLEGMTKNYIGLGLAVAAFFFAWYRDLGKWTIGVLLVVAIFAGIHVRSIQTQLDHRRDEISNLYSNP